MTHPRLQPSDSNPVTTGKNSPSGHVRPGLHRNANRASSPIIWEMSVETQLLSGLAALLAGRQPVQVVAVTVNPRKFSTPPDTFQ